MRPMLAISLFAFAAFAQRPTVVLPATPVGKLVQGQITANGKTVTVNVYSGPKCWRLVHNTTKVLSLNESSGVTRTIDTLWVSSPTDPAQPGAVTSAVGQAQALAEIATLGLKYAPAKTAPTQ